MRHHQIRTITISTATPRTPSLQFNFIEGPYMIYDDEHHDHHDPKCPLRLISWEQKFKRLKHPWWWWIGNSDGARERANRHLTLEELRTTWNYPHILVLSITFRIDHKGSYQGETQESEC